MSLPQPYWQSPDARHVIYCADCRELLPLLKPTLPKDTAVVTDPPYGIGVASRSFYGITKRRNALASPKDYGDGKWDDSPATSEHIENCLLGQTIIFGGNFFALPPASCWLVWDKITDGVAFADCELAWTNLGGAVRIFRHQWRGMMRDSERGIERNHPTQKPIALMVWCIGFVTSQTILDPFMGSGTTGVACIRTGRKFIGIEIESKYCQIAKERMERELAQPCLPALAPERATQQDLIPNKPKQPDNQGK